MIRSVTILTLVTDMTRVTKHTYRTLSAWRVAKQLSQQEAAKRLGLSQSFYSKLERGLHALPGERAKHITQQTGVPLEVLVGAA